MTSRTLYADITGCAVFTPASIGDLTPFTTPNSHLADLFFHSSLDYFALATAATTTSISHALIAAATGFVTFNFPQVPYSETTFYAETDTDWLLKTHSLGFVPNFMVLDSNGMAIPNVFPIQRNGSGHREVSFYATTTEIRMKEIAKPGNVALSAFSKSYTIYIFKQVAADPLKGYLEMDPPNAHYYFGQGKFDGALSFLRPIIAGETATIHYPLGRETDIANGVVRFVQDTGTITDLDGTYNGVALTFPGSFAGSTFAQMLVT